MVPAECQQHYHHRFDFVGNWHFYRFSDSMGRLSGTGYDGIQLTPEEFQLVL